MTGNYVEGSYWFYAPNKGAPVAFAVFFAISMLWHVHQCISYKCWKVTGIFPWSALLFVAGYILREIGAYHYDNLPIFIASLVLIYAAPPLYELANYFILSRILYYIPYCSPLHPGRVFSTFGFISAVIEAINANGAALVANTSLPAHKQKTGKSLLKAALVIQLAVLCAFVSLTVHFHRTCKRERIMPKNLRNVIRTLYASSALIGARTIFRTVEYFVVADLNFYVINDPNTVSSLLRYEAYFWVFESSFMVVNTLLMNVMHPMKVLPENTKIYLARDGVTEIEGPGYVDRRKFWVTLVDPFDLNGVFRKRSGKEERFWEMPGQEREVVSGATHVGGTTRVEDMKITTAV